LLTKHFFIVTLELHLLIKHFWVMFADFAGIKLVDYSTK